MSGCEDIQIYDVGDAVVVKQLPQSCYFPVEASVLVHDLRFIGAKLEDFVFERFDVVLLAFTMGSVVLVNRVRRANEVEVGHLPLRPAHLFSSFEVSCAVLVFGIASLIFGIYHIVNVAPYA